MNLDNIKADEVVIMTGILYRLFSAAGCEPTCHCCSRDLRLGIKFKLSTMPIDPERGEREVMLCTKCTVAGLVKGTKEQIALMKKQREKRIADNVRDAVKNARYDAKYEGLSKAATERLLKKVAKEEAQRPLGCFRINGRIMP